MKPPAFLRSLRPLHWTLALSVGLHAALLTLRFAPPDGLQRLFHDLPLEVVLVNARTDEAPDQAQALAQAALAGGGEAARGRASTPLPYSGLNAEGDAYEDTERQIDQLRQQQDQLLTQLRAQIATLAPPDPQQPPGQPGERVQEEKRRQLIKLLAEIEKRINEDNAVPRKRYISPATREAAYAQYYAALRQKVEDKGTRHFPTHKGQKLYGELIMIVTVNHDGQVVETEVVQGSGQPLLDRRAEAIARSAGPFGRFTTEMRRQADQLAMVARFKFTREQTLETGGQ